MVYICTDIHGNWEVYQAILQKLKEDDHLYIIGDVIDRGPDGIRILQDLIHRKNVTFLLGNHEWMMLSSIPDLPDNVFNEDMPEIWTQRCNGGSITVDAFYDLDEPSQREILKFLLDAPIYLRIRENGKTYNLIHGWYEDRAEQMLGCTYRDIFHRIDHGATWEGTMHFDALWNSVLKGDTSTHYDLKPEEYFIHGHVPVFRVSGNVEPLTVRNMIFLDGGLQYGGAEILYNLTDGSYQLIQ